MLPNAYLPPPSKLTCHHLHLFWNGVLNLTPTYLLHTRHPIYRFFFRTSLNDWVCLLVQNKHNIQSHVINVMFLSMINYPFCRQINYSLPNYSQKLLFICPGNSYIFDTILINSGSRPTLMIGQHAKTIFKENLLTTLIMFQRKVG